MQLRLRVAVLYIAVSFLRRLVHRMCAGRAMDGDPVEQKMIPNVERDIWADLNKMICQNGETIA